MAAELTILRNDGVKIEHASRIVAIGTLRSVLLTISPPPRIYPDSYVYTTHRHVHPIRRVVTAASQVAENANVAVSSPKGMATLVVPGTCAAEGIRRTVLVLVGRLPIVRILDGSSEVQTAPNLLQPAIDVDHDAVIVSH